jgi:hypothetical protein
MKININFAFKVFFSGGIYNLLLIYKAMDLNITISFIILFLLIAFPILNLLLYKYTKYLSNKKSYHLKVSNIFLIFFLLLISIFSMEFFNKKTQENKKNLVLSFPFLKNKNEKILFDKNLIEKNENQIKKIYLNDLKKKPNIFIFISEATRSDFITKEITPNIYNFKKDNISCIKSFSAANASQQSWFSIFHSNNAISFSGNHKNYSQGSLALNILKKLGYTLNVYTSSDLKYFHMDEILFGKNHHLIDTFFDLSSSDITPAKRDKKAIEEFKKKLNKNIQANVYIFFLDSTHSEYSWGDDFKIKFLPIVNKINYISLAITKKNIEPLKNRYKNALNYIDHLFKTSVDTIKDNNLYADSIIVFTSDHGEEFNELGSLFHGSSLNKYQLSIPIIYKLNKTDDICTISSHIDIFPTILNSITNSFEFDELFDGKSIFSKNRQNYVISAKQNGALRPNEIIFNYDDSFIMGKINKDKNTYFLEIQSDLNDKFLKEIN